MAPRSDQRVAEGSAKSMGKPAASWASHSGTKRAGRESSWRAFCMPVRVEGVGFGTSLRLEGNERARRTPGAAGPAGIGMPGLLLSR